MQNYLTDTNLLDYRHPTIVDLFAQRCWDRNDSGEIARSIYEFVRDDILFGYNAFEPIKASEVLRDGYGQCNTKAILLMALLRRAGIQSRFHVFGIDKSLQKGAHHAFVYDRLPQTLQHSWVEAFVDNRWIVLEGCIIDRRYIASLQKQFLHHESPFNGFAVSVHDLHNLNIEWSGQDTWIQRAAIVEDRGTFESPDEFYSNHRSNLEGWRGIAWRTLYYRRTMNRIANIRAGKFPHNAAGFLNKLPKSIFTREPAETNSIESAN